VNVPIPDGFKLAIMISVLGVRFNSLSTIIKSTQQVDNQSSIDVIHAIELNFNH